MSLPRHRRAKAVPVTVVDTETPHADTQVIEPVPEVTEVIALDAPEPVTPEEVASWADYIREPVPDLDSPDPADRTEWLRLHEGDETDFAAILNDHPEWLYLIGLPEPVRTAPEAAEDTTDPGPEDAPPPGGERAAETTTAPDPSPEPSGPVSTEDESAAEQDCAEGSDVA